MMKMKKIIVFITIILFIGLLSWCNKTTNLTYNETYSTFVNNMKWSLFFKNDFSLNNFSWYLNENFDLIVTSKDSQIDSDMKINYDADVDTSWLNSKWNVNFYINIQNNLKNKKSIFSWNSDFVNINNNVYIKLNNLYMDLWTWNIEWKILDLLLTNYKKKRVQLDSYNNANTKKDLMKEIKNLNNIKEEIKNLNNIFVQSGNSSVNSSWNQVFFVKLSNETKTKIMDILNIWTWINDIFSNSNISFVVKSKNDIELNINWIKVKNWQISASISKNTVYITKKDNYWNNSMISIERMRNDIVTNIIIDMKKWIKTNLINKIKIYYVMKNIKYNDNIFSSDFNWKIDIYNTETPSPLSKLFNWKFNISKIKELKITQPKSYVLMSQILWDPYLLQSSLDNVSTWDLE